MNGEWHSGLEADPNASPSRNQTSKSGAASSLASIYSKHGSSVLRALKNVSWLTIGGVVAQLLTAIAAAIVTRHSSTHAFGILASGLGVVAFLADLTDFGTGAYLARELALGTHTTIEAFRGLKLRMLAVATITFAGSALSIVSLPRERSLICLLTIYVIAFVWWLSLAALLRALGAYRTIALATVLDRCALLVVVASCAALGANTVIGFASGLGCGSLCAAAICYWTGLRPRLATAELRVQAATKLSLRTLYWRSRSFGISNIATDLQVVESPLVMLGAGSAATGIYGAAGKIAGPMSIPASAVATLVLRAIARSPRDPIHIEKVIRKHMLILVPYAVALAGIAWSAPYLMRFVFGGQYETQGAVVLRVVCITIFLAAANQILYVGLMSAMQEKRIAVCLWVSVLVGLLFTFLGAKAGGAGLAAAGGIVGQVVALCGQLIVLRRALAYDARPPASDH